MLKRIIFASLPDDSVKSRWPFSSNSSTRISFFWTFYTSKYSHTKKLIISYTAYLKIFAEYNAILDRKPWNKAFGRNLSRKSGMIPHRIIYIHSDDCLEMKNKKKDRIFLKFNLYCAHGRYFVRNELILIRY